MKEIFNNNFRSTGDNSNPESIDFNILGLHKKEYFDANGDLTKIELFLDYDSVNDVYIDLAVVEDRTYTRSATTGLIIKRETVISWYDESGSVAKTSTTIAKYYSAKKGFTANKRSRQNIIDNASMYLFSQLAANDYPTADANVDDFEDLTNSAQSKYINSNTQPLLDIITNSTDNTKPEYRDYITPAIQTALLSILTIHYK